ncbi:MAG: hypothetical protein PVH50_09335, partial [Anaerolineae bacterium]
LPATVAWVSRLTRSFWGGLLSAAILLVQGSFLRYSMAGMETPLYTLFIVLALLVLSEDMTQLGACLAALAVLMRLDGLAIAGTALLCSFVRRRELPWREAGIMALILAPWIIFAWAYFGSPLPQSMLAKQQHFRAQQRTIFWIWDYLFVRPMGRNMFLTPLAALGMFLPLRREIVSSKWLAPSVWLTAYLAAYTLVHIDFYEWYLVPAFPVLACFASNGIAATVRAAGRIGWIPSALRRAVVGVGVSALLLPYGRHAYPHVTSYKGYLSSLEASRVAVGAWLLDQTAPEAVVETGAIGHIGYVSKRHILDSAGLVTTRHLRVGTEPDYLVLQYPPVGRQECGPVKYFETGWAPSPHLVISRCSEVKAKFGPLLLSEARITEWILDESSKLRKEPRPYLETQWLLHARSLDSDWTLYAHFTRPDGLKVAQADHLLGSTGSGAALPTGQWPTDQRVYDYVPLPDKLMTVTGPLELRLGVWDPSSGERLEAEPVSADKDSYGRIVIKLLGSP